MSLVVMFWVCVFQSGFGTVGVQSMESGCCVFRVGAELTDAVWNESCESEDSMTMSCLKVV